MKHIRKLLFGALASCTLFSGCNENSAKENLETCEEYIYNDSLSSIPVYGLVTDADGNYLGNVLVTTGKDTTLTDENGSYSFSKCRMVNGRSVVKFEDREHFTVVRTAEAVDGGVRLDAVLMPQDSREGVTETSRFASREGTTITVGKMTIFIPANALVYEKDGKEFNGSVFASTYYLNPNSENFTKEMPGGDMSGVTADGKSVILLSYGMVEVTLKDSANQKLQLKEGVKSDLTFPVPEGFADEQLHNQIPLWFFDEEKGTWIEEGTATKKENTYTGKVSHFSWHNLDYPSTRATIKGRVTDSKGNPIPNVLVTISQTSAFTDYSGYYSAFVPYETPVFVTVKPEDYGNYTKSPIYRIPRLRSGTEYVQDIVLPYKKAIHGKVREKNWWRSGISVCTSNGLSTVTNYGGNYRIFLKDDEPFSITTPLSPKNKKYSFDSPSEVIDTVSYDFEIPSSHCIRGWVGYSDDPYSDVKASVTLKIGNTKSVVKTSYSGYYCFAVSDETTDEVTAYVEDEVLGVISNTVKAKPNSYFMPKIYINNTVSVRGSFVNTCGPSLAKVNIECRKGKTKKTISQKTAYGYFNVRIPLSMKDWKIKLKAECNNKRFSKKIDISSGKYIDLGTTEYCSGEKPEPDCIYAIIGEKTVKFDTKKDVYCEMIQQTNLKTSFSRNNKEYRYANKYQVWYKSPDYNGTLIINMETYVEKDGSHIESNMPNNKNFVTLITEDNKIYTSSIENIYKPDGTLLFKSDIYITPDSENDDDDIYIYNSPLTIQTKLAHDNIDQNYISKNLLDKSTKILVGITKDSKFYKAETKLENSKQIENALKSKGFKEKSTFMNDENMISSIFLQENAEALLRRDERKADVTILFREGIGNEPTSHCWKVDFRQSSARKKGEPSINYMWKNEADIVDLIMFGQLMGIKFTKTDNTEEKCGCSTGNGPAVAN